MDNYLKKWMVHLAIAGLLVIPCLVTAAQLDQQQNPQPGLQPNLQQILQQNLQPSLQQTEDYKKLSPEQQKAITEELTKTGGNLTPEAMEALKTRPEFQGLTPQDIVKGKELLEKQEAAKAKLKPQVVPEGEKKMAEKPEAIKIERAFELEKAEPEKKVIGEEAKPQSLYDRSREIRKYQDIALDLKPFGYDFFREAAVNVITQRKDLPVPLKYVVGPGDEVRLVMWGRVNGSYNITVDRDGKINIPTIGPLNVAGMSFEQMSQYLIKQAGQITGTNVDVSMGSLRSIPVFILGDVRRPGAYTIGSFATITDALLLAGGPTEIGTMRKIQLKRKDKLIQTFDLYDLLLKGDKSNDATLSAGDIVFVPVIGPYVGVAGNVRRPAIYELREGSSLGQLFELAGGIIPAAYTQQIQVERTVKNEKKVIVDIDDKDLSQAYSVVLQDADLVKVFSIVEKDANVITLQGNVKRGGKYALKPGMRLGDILKDPLLDLLPETYFDYALIKRQNPPKMEPLLIPFNLGDLLIRHDPASNPDLQPLDTIYIFSKWFFQDKPVFTISGEVRKSGKFDLADNIRMKDAAPASGDVRKSAQYEPADNLKAKDATPAAGDVRKSTQYELADNFKVKDAILTAGGLTKNAHLKKGEIIRVNKKKEYQTLYFDVAKALADDPAENIAIQDEDQIIIHSLYEEQWKEVAMVAGEVKTPGEFIVTEKMRVSDLIFKAGGQTRDTLLDQAELYRTDWKTKEVTLRNIKLGRALQGDLAENLELRDMDRLIVHSIWEKVYKKSVTVEGDVLKPGTYPLADNMTVRELIFTAGNVLESASLEDGEISSHVIDRNNQAGVVHRKINLAKAMAGDQEHNVSLKPSDRLFIQRIPDWRSGRFVSLLGEFRFPGRYMIGKGEKLSSVIGRAGGFKDGAYLRGAYFTRDRVRELQQKSLFEMADRLERELLASSGKVATALSPEEVAGGKIQLEQRQKFIESMRKLKATGRMTLHLANMRLLRGSENDIEMEDGDSLLVPMKNSVVNVVGDVMAQGSYIYSEKLDYLDYINQTGGYASYADTDNVFVLKVDGSARKLSRGFFSWSPLRSRWELSHFGEEIRQIEPGDTIVVPEKTDHIAWLREFRDITQILMNTAVVAGVVMNLW